MFSSLINSLRSCLFKFQNQAELHSVLLLQAIFYFCLNLLHLFHLLLLCLIALYIFLLDFKFPAPNPLYIFCNLHFLSFKILPIYFSFNLSFSYFTFLLFKLLATLLSASLRFLQFYFLLINFTQFTSMLA